METKVEIRQAERGEMAEVARVFKLSRDVALPDLPSLHTPEEDADYFSQVVFDNNEVLIALEEDLILGFIAFDDQFVNHLYIVPDNARRGIGTALLDIAKGRRAALRLWTFQVNDGARKFYARQGFKEIEWTDGSGNEEKQPDVLLEWLAGDPRQGKI